MIFRKVKPRVFLPLEERGPLNVMFLLSSMPVGGAETLLVNLVQRMSDQFRPGIVCLKEPGELGERIASEFPVHSNLISHKYDLGVIGKLKKLFVESNVDATVTVGAGDKMFWGRIAANRARVPVILSALHSTGWPDGVGRLNRMLTPITDRFIAVAENHGRFMVEHEKFPRSKVRVIPNGVDTQRFQKDQYDRLMVRKELGIDRDDPVCGIIAALRSEKNHLLFLRSAALVCQELPDARFLIVGDGPERPMLENAVSDLSLRDNVIFTGSRSDVPELLSAIDVFSLTSRNEASPVSIMEAMSMEIPVVAPDVGSISETVQHGETGFLFQQGNAEKIADYWLTLLNDPDLSRRMGQAGRQVIQSRSSLEIMVRGYEDLIQEVYGEKFPGRKSGRPGDTGSLPLSTGSQVDPSIELESVT